MLHLRFLEDDELRLENNINYTNVPKYGNFEIEIALRNSIKK